MRRTSSDYLAGPSAARNQEAANCSRANDAKARLVAPERFRKSRRVERQLAFIAGFPPIGIVQGCPASAACWMRFWNPASEASTL